MFKSDHRDEDKVVRGLIAVIGKLMVVIIILVIGIIAIPFVIYYNDRSPASGQKNEPGRIATDAATKDSTVYWTAPDINSITDTVLKAQVGYGKELIMHTAKYFGPKGSLSPISNGMNCQNCHLDAGTKTWGNNYGSVSSLYPKFRARSGTVESVYKRVNDCFERSLNGKAIDSTGKEMKAITAYINFLGSNVTKGKKAEGSGFKELAFLDRAADPQKGQGVYTSKCITCHQADGGGQLNPDLVEYMYPPLWGKNSYNDGAGLYRISSFARYVKYNMPQGTTYDHPQLSDEEAWDIAAFVNTQPRPHINVPRDWPDISKKPVDHPFGPYIDSFTETQHKYGPFKPIDEEQKKRDLAAKPAVKK